MWQTTPLKRNLTLRFREDRIWRLGSEDKNWYDRKEMIDEMIETTLYASKVLDNQGWNVDQWMVGSKIFYSNQTIKQVNTFGLQCRRDSVKSKALSLAFLLLMKVFSCRWQWHHLALLHLSLLTVLPKGFGIRQPNRIGGLRVRLEDIRV
jgi:hypothetical protein